MMTYSLLATTLIMGVILAIAGLIDAGHIDIIVHSDTMTSAISAMAH